MAFLSKGIVSSIDNEYGIPYILVFSSKRQWYVPTSQTLDGACAFSRSLFSRTWDVQRDARIYVLRNPWALRSIETFKRDRTERVEGTNICISMPTRRRTDRCSVYRFRQSSSVKLRCTERLQSFSFSSFLSLSLFLSQISTLRTKHCIRPKLWFACLSKHARERRLGLGYPNKIEIVAWNLLIFSPFDS